MLQKIVELSLRNRLMVVLLLTVLMGIGGWLLPDMPVDAFPDTTPVQVQINTVAPALSPGEIEQQITAPVELSIGGLPGLRDVRSVSKFGFSQVTATFDDNTKIIDARQYISERLDSVELPGGIERPQLGPISTGLGEIFHYVVRSENPGRTLEQLRTIHDWTIKPELRKVRGVAEVVAWGGHEKQYHVIVSIEALLKYNLTLDEVFEALETNNQNVGGGVVTTAGQSKQVHGVGRTQSIEEIGNIVIDAFDGAPVLIKDIAEDIRIGHEIRRGAVTAQGRGEVVLGLAFMLMGENAKTVTEDLKEQLENVRKSVPDDVIIEVVYDRTELTTQVIQTVKHNLLIGAALVVLALLILLGDIRAGLIVAVVIPLAMLLAVMGMYNWAIAASLLSLGAIDFGIIVDGSVVMTEANMRNLAEKATRLNRKLTAAERLESMIDSAKQVARPIGFGMGIILIVFVPILTLEGIEGKMFKPMAWTFIFALAGALLIALTLSPVLGYYCLSAKPRGKASFFNRSLGAAYGFLLTRAMKARWVILPVVAIILSLSIWTASRLGGEFIPRLSEGAIAINVIRLAGISIDESVAYNTRIEKWLLKKFPNEIRQIWSRIGTAEVATDPMGTELTDIFISLTPSDQWTRATTQAQLSKAMEDELADFPGLNMVFTQPIELRMNEIVTGVRSDLAVKIYGDDFEELVRISNEVQLVLLQVPGQSDIAVDQLTGQPTLRIKVNQRAIARYGIPAKHVLELVEIVGSHKVGEVFEGQRQFPLVVRLPDRYRTDSEVLKNTIIPTKTGPRLPLRMLADVSDVEGYATINREWGRRLIRVQCNVSGRDVASFVKDAKLRIEQQIKLPPGYVINWGGQFENLQRAQRRLMIVVPVTLLLVFFMLYFSLKNLRDVLLIYTGIPFALIGGVFALWLRDLPFSISAAVGFIALSGIAVLNGQILVTAIRSYSAEGSTLREAVIEAAKQRLRPVLATAVTDAVGFIPMAISTGVGAEVQRPLATVVIGGVLTSTLLTLFVLPLLYIVVVRRIRNTSGKDEPDNPSHEADST